MRTHLAACVEAPKNLAKVKEEGWAPVAEDIALRPRDVSPESTKVIAGRTDGTRQSAEVVILETRIAEITTRLANRDNELSATKMALTKARAQAAVLSEELRNRGGTKHYSNLTVKLGVAEAEIRSLAARKTQLAIRLAHVERERDKALQGQAIAEATLHNKSRTAIAAFTGESKGPNQSCRQTSCQEHHQHPPLDRVDSHPLQITPAKTKTTSEECPPNDTPADEVTRGDGVVMVTTTLGSAGIGRGTPESHEDFSECVSGENHDPQVLRRKPAYPCEREVVRATEVKASRPAGERHLRVPVGGRDLGHPTVVSKRTKGGAALAGALERARASERRCVALLAATSRELETERREAQILRDTLRRIEEADHSAVAGGDYAETETYPAKETAIEATEGCTNGGDQLNLALEMGRGSLLQAASATALGLLDHKLNVGAIGVVTALASFGVVLAAVATAGLLLFLPSSL